VNTQSVRLKSKVVYRSRKCHQDSSSSSETGEEPPGKFSISGNLEEEPPDKTAANRPTWRACLAGRQTDRHRFFSHITNNLWNNWKWQFQNRITTIEQLAQFISLSAEEQAQLKLVTIRYPLSVTPYYLSLINPHDPDDPLSKQAIPSILEITMDAMGDKDPLNEKGNSVVPGLVHRSPDQVLMVLTDICPMLCRHCTRKREWQNNGWVRTPAEVEDILDYIRHHKTIRDVIISGGDPLTLSTRRLEDIISRIREIRHVEIIRIGTRFPVVLPQRIDHELCTMLAKYGPIWLNTHFNHAREITLEAAKACDRLMRSGIPLNNQSVLLRGINDSVKAQTELCHGLLRIKVRPYCLFQCDEVQGTEHLRIPVESGIKIIEGMRGHTSGMAVPTFVIDLPQGSGNVPIQPNYMLAQTEDELVLRNYQGNIFHYRNPAKQVNEKSPAEAVSLLGDAVGTTSGRGLNQSQKEFKMWIGLSYDLKETVAEEQADDNDDALEEYDSPETVELIAASLEAEGHTVVLLDGGREFLKNILREKVDFVFNIAEGRGNYRSREAQVPSILEMLNIPYSGSDPQCLTLCLDKPLTKKIVASAGVCTPRWRVINNRQELCQINGSDFPFPAIVKPAYEGSSKGIRFTSVVEGSKQAIEVIEDLLERYHQPVIIEEFITGDEVTLGIIGNSQPNVLGIMRILPKRTDGYFVYSLEVKRDYLNLVNYECPARLNRKVLQNLEASGLNAFMALGCRDFARLDFRVSSEGVPYFLEINPLPGLGTHSDLVIMARELGWTHRELIAGVLNTALERYPQCVHV